jgi:hypothetical protein
MRSVDPEGRGIRMESQTKMTFEYTGIYSITYSIQFNSTDTSVHDTNVWLRKNGNGASGNLANTDTRFSITNSHGGTEGSVVGTVNYVLRVDAGDYLELIWAVTNAAIYIHAEALASSPFAHPGIPGIICTVVQVASA